MTPQEVSILDLLAERDRTTAAKLDAIGNSLQEVREDLRVQRQQLAGVATGAEIASLKRQVNAETDALSTRVLAVERRLDTREAIEADADARRRRRAWVLPSSAQLPVGMVLLLAGAAVERFLGG